MALGVQKLPHPDRAAPYLLIITSVHSASFYCVTAYAIEGRSQLGRVAGQASAALLLIPVSRRTTTLLRWALAASTT